MHLDCLRYYSFKSFVSRASGERPIFLNEVSKSKAFAMFQCKYLKKLCFLLRFNSLWNSNKSTRNSASTRLILPYVLQTIFSRSFRKIILKKITINKIVIKKLLLFKKILPFMIYIKVRKGSLNKKLLMFPKTISTVMGRKIYLKRKSNSKRQLIIFSLTNYLSTSIWTNLKMN